MDTEVDHYMLLGLPSGEEGTKLTHREISKAYRAKALDLHPDKRRDDPNADANFQRLKSSYEILKDQNGRKLFDASLRAKRELEQRHQNRLHWHWQHNNGRYCLGSDLEARAIERRWAPTWKEARGKGTAINGTREELFGDLEGILKRVQKQHHDHWQCEANPERCSVESKRCSLISNQDNKETLRGECHLKLPMVVLLFLLALWSMADIYGVCSCSA